MLTPTDPAWCRCSEAVATAQAHVDQRGKGAVGSIVQLSEDLLVSAGTAHAVSVNTPGSGAHCPRAGFCRRRSKL